MRALVLVAVLVAIAACNKGGGNNNCDAVGARFHGIAEADLAKDKDIDRRERDAVHGLVGPMRDALVKACRESGWSPEARGCMVAAADEGGFRACELKLSGEQRALLEQAAAKGIQSR